MMLCALAVPAHAGATVTLPVPVSGASADAAAAGTATPSPGPSVSPTAENALSAKDAGTIDGHVSSIDYKSGKMTVDVGEGGAKKSYDVLVVPGTTIQGQKDFHTIADLKKGAHVQVLMSRHGTTNTAQIIRLL
jgi:Cu/Ag efflux protein CusF